MCAGDAAAATNGGGGGQDFEAASCLLLAIPGETTQRSSRGGGGGAGVGGGEISSDVEGRRWTELKLCSERRLKSPFFLSFFAHFNIHPHTHKPRAQPDSSAKPPLRSSPPLPVKSIAIFCITTCKDCGGLVYCI